MDSVENTNGLTGWIPFNFSDGNVQWLYMGNERFVEPFSETTLRKLAYRPFNRLFRPQTDIGYLAERADTHPGLTLNGLIFHMSRCGSTLCAQALAALDDTVVLSEPACFDALIHWRINSGSGDKNLQSRRLQDLLAALGQARRLSDRRLFVKTDCWHIRHIDGLLAAFPGVPWIFLYRDPVEVLVSQARLPGMINIPGVLMEHGLKPPEDLLIKPLAHAGWVLGQVLECAYQALQSHEGGLPVNYRELPMALETRIANHFRLNLDENSLAAVRNVYNANAKNPSQPFQADGAAKLAEASPEILSIRQTWLAEPYRRLEELRRQLLMERSGKA